MMRNEKTLEKIINIMTANFPQLKEIQDSLWDRGTKLADDLQLDSFSIVTLQVAIEDNFKIQFDPLEDDFVEIFCNMGRLVDFVNEKCEKKF